MPYNCTATIQRSSQIYIQPPIKGFYVVFPEFNIFIAYPSGISTGYIYPVIYVTKPVNNRFYYFFFRIFSYIKLNCTCFSTVLHNHISRRLCTIQVDISKNAYCSVSSKFFRCCPAYSRSSTGNHCNTTLHIFICNQLQTPLHIIFFIASTIVLTVFKSSCSVRLLSLYLSTQNIM